MGERSPCRYTCGRHHVTPAQPDTAAQPPPIAPLSPHQRYETEAVGLGGRRLQTECQKEQDSGSPAARHWIGRHTAFPHRRRDVELSRHRLRARTDSFSELTGSATARLGSRYSGRGYGRPAPRARMTASHSPRAVQVWGEATGRIKAGPGRVEWGGFWCRPAPFMGCALPRGRAYLGSREWPLGLSEAEPA